MNKSRPAVLGPFLSPRSQKSIFNNFVLSTEHKKRNYKLQFSNNLLKISMKCSPKSMLANPIKINGYFSQFFELSRFSNYFERSTIVLKSITIELNICLQTIELRNNDERNGKQV